MGHDLQRQRRHGKDGARCLRRLALGDLRAARLAHPPAGRPQGIKVVNTGGFGARLKALLDGEVEAASLLPPQIAMAEQLGLRQIIADTFKTLWWVPDNFEPDVVRGYLRALDRAEKAMDDDMEKYLPLWKLAVPTEFENFHPWDYSKFGRGERFCYRTLPREEFDDTLAQVKRWGLDQYLKDRSYETLTYSR